MTKQHDEQMEKEIVELGLTAPRVTLDSIIDAKEKAQKKLLELEGYRLKFSPRQPSDFIGRLQVEHDELTTKHNGLMAFLQSPKFDDLDEDNKNMLVAQNEAMQVYRDILLARLQKLKGE